MMIIQVLVYQYCVIKPLLSVLRAFLEYADMADPYEMGFMTPSFWIMFFRVISLMVAMMALLVFYRCCSKALNRYNVVLKFAVIKVLIALHIAQNLAFKIMVNLDWIKDGDEVAQVRSVRIQYLLSVIEMAILAILLPYAYPVSDKASFFYFYFFFIFIFNLFSFFSFFSFTFLQLPLFSWLPEKAPGQLRHGELQVGHARCAPRLRCPEY